MVAAGCRDYVRCAVRRAADRRACVADVDGHRSNGDVRFIAHIAQPPTGSTRRTESAPLRAVLRVRISVPAAATSLTRARRADLRRVALSRPAAHAPRRRADVRTWPASSMTALDVPVPYGALFGTSLAGIFVATLCVVSVPARALAHGASTVCALPGLCFRVPFLNASPSVQLWHHRSPDYPLLPQVPARSCAMEGVGRPRFVSLLNITCHPCIEPPRFDVVRWTLPRSLCSSLPSWSL
jgi:hypothetical protein